VQTCVVALGLDVAHLRTAHEPGDAGQLDRDGLVTRVRAPAPDSTTRRTASASRAARTGLHQVVDGLHLERFDGVSS